MPTETGRFTNEELSKLHELIGQKKIDPDAECPNCFNRDWHLTPFEARVPFSDPQKYMPIVSLICTNCGYLKSFNAIVAGIVENTENNNGSG
jgi:C4-type Zn-finger protein